MNTFGKHLALFLAAFLLCVAASPVLAQDRQALRPEAEQLMALANRARSQAGAPPLRWDSALAEAACKHTLLMVTQGPIAHIYPGELSLTKRAGFAGAHFDLIEENVAIGATPGEIHDEWMHSTGHRQNMLNPAVDRVGIAVVASRGVLYATADYSHGVMQLSQSQVEERIAGLIRPSRVTILPNPTVAREACRSDSGLPRIAGGVAPSFVMRWQDSDVDHLPKSLVDKLASGQFHNAAVGSCEPSGVDGTFTAYRLAVLLY